MEDKGGDEAEKNRNERWRNKDVIWMMKIMSKNRKKREKKEGRKK